MEPCGILDSRETKIISELVDRRIAEMERNNFCIITNADRENIERDIKNELFLKTGKAL